MNAGFTLGELLAVTAIIGILVAVSIPLFLGYLQKSRETVCLNNRTDARRMLVSQQILTQEDTLQKVAETEEGKDILSQFKCPAGGRIYVDGDTVKCTFHGDGKEAETSAPEENPYANLSPFDKANTFINLAYELGKLRDEIFGNGDDSINKIDDNIQQMNTIIQNKKHELSPDKLNKINELAGEINTIADGLDDVPRNVQDEIAQLGTSIQYENLNAVMYYRGIIQGYIDGRATQADGEEAANKKYPDMLNTLNTNLPTLNKVNDQLTDCKGKITTINQKLSEINELLKDE